MRRTRGKPVPDVATKRSQIIKNEDEDCVALVTPPKKQGKESSSNGGLPKTPSSAPKQTSLNSTQTPSPSPSPSKRKRSDAEMEAAPSKRGAKWEKWEDQVLLKIFLDRYLTSNEWNTALGEINAGRDADEPRTVIALKRRWDLIRSKLLD